MKEIFTGILIALGAGIILLSARKTRQVLSLLAEDRYFRDWRMLFWLMVFFLLGYGAALAFVLAGSKEFLVVLTGVIFFFGALFVYLVVRVGYLTIDELLKTTVSQEHTHNIVKSMLNSLLVVAPEGAIKTVNQAACELLGYREVELIGQPIDIIFAKKEEELFKGAGFEELINKGSIKNVEKTYLSKEARQIAVLFSASAIYNTAGQLKEIICVAQDITERKQAERTLQKQRAEQQVIFDTVPAMIWYKDTENRILRLNKRAAKSMGRPVAEIEGKSVYELHSREEAEQYYQDDLTVINSGEPKIDIIEPLQTASGEYRWIRTDKIPYRDQQGHINGVVVFSRDITERKQAENALHESEERFRQVITSLSHHVYMTEVTNEGQQINRYISPNIEPLTGYPLKKFMTDWSFWPSTVIHPDDRAGAATQAARLSQGQSSETEYRLVRADDQIIWVNDSGRVEKDKARQSFLVYGVVSDITERKRAEMALIMARDQALEASRLKTQLLANVSHDLRTPLNAILGYTEMLQEGIYGSLSEPQRNVASEIIDSTGQLLDFVNNMLNQARIKAGKITLNITPFTPAQLVDNVQSTLTVVAKAKGLTLTSDVAPNVPPTLAGDSYWLRQILINLVGNAIKFTNQGSIQIYVYRYNEELWAVQVADTGCGIPVEAQSYIFDLFRQVDGTATRGHGGSGLGLSIVKQLTTLMGGQIILNSEVGQGSTFTILLPLQTIPEKIQ